MNEVYELRDGMLVVVSAESHFPTKQPKITFWEKSLSWKLETIKDWLTFASYRNNVMEEAEK
jgi:hypothetical protein